MGVKISCYSSFSVLSIAKMWRFIVILSNWIINHSSHFKILKKRKVWRYQMGNQKPLVEEG